MTKNNMAIHRVLPFVLFMGFIGLEEGFRILYSKETISLSSQFPFYLYPIKAISVTILLIFFANRFVEINLYDLLKVFPTSISIFVGILVFTLWINMDWSFAIIGNPQGFDPRLIENEKFRSTIIASRFFGAVIVVPIMEELFWRSFLIRYLINSDFEKVPIGYFTWPSFIISIFLFGLEHNLFLAGLMAGCAYNLLLYYTKSIAHCIIAHAITNLALALYVLNSGKWHFW